MDMVKPTARQLITMQTFFNMSRLSGISERVDESVRMAMEFHGHSTRDALYSETHYAWRRALLILLGSETTEPPTDRSE